MKELLDNLNDSQKEAVLFNDGPSLIIAGAGSGKTRVLTYKIATLLKSGLPPWSIMALTFTNKAAREMKERIAQLVDPASAARLWMGTFHSVFLRILRSEASRLGYPSNFTIYDTTDSKNLIKSIIKDMDLDDKVYKVNHVQSRISSAKNDLISPEAYAANSEIQIEDVRSKRPLIKEIYLRYTERCKLASAMDFDDILLMTNILFRDFPDVLASYQDRFNFILVDEYQDTNFSQYLIVKKLSDKQHHICVVGDDSQSIYSFRGANIENILNFKNTYPESKLFKLEQNYRSTQIIVEAANSLIAKNKSQIHKHIFSKNDKGSRIPVLIAYSDLEEGFMVANKIVEMRLTSLDNLNDFAILYRTNAQSRIFEESLRKRNLLYRVYGGLSFYQRKEIKDVVAYLRLLLNPDDEEAFKRIVNYPPRGIGETTQQKLIAAANAHRTGISNIVEHPLQYEVQLNSGTVKKLETFQALIQKFRQQIFEKNVYEIAEQLLRESGIINDVSQDTSSETISRKENLQELLSGMNEFVNSRLEEGNEAVLLNDYLSEISLLTDQDEEKSAEGDRITLMTIHAAKGLEFKNVFVVGLEEEIFPSAYSLDSERALEEERRLLYVAMTRAERTCLLSYAKSRFRNGQINFTKPSRFLGDLDQKLLDIPSESSAMANTGTRSWDEERSGSFGTSLFGHKSDHSVSERFGSYGSPFAGTRPGEHSTGKTGFQTGGNSTSRQRQSTTRLSANPLSVKSRTVSANSGKSPVKLPSASRQSTVTNQSATIQNYQDLGVGQHILHERFGKGEIMTIEGKGPDCTINVQFEHSGTRKLLLKFARFSLLD